MKANEKEKGKRKEERIECGNVAKKIKESRSSICEEEIIVQVV